MARVFLGLGTNMGEKEQNLQRASSLLAEKVGKILALSSFYETKPWGFESENMFLNAVVEIETDHKPLRLLEETQELEREMGRTSKSAGSYKDRIIDIDILLDDNMIMKSDSLTIPHPLMQERKFVMEPLAEIASDMIHPVLKLSMKELNERL